MRFVVYKDAAGEWRWQKLADSGEGYKRRGSAVKAIKRIQRFGETAIITDENNVAIA
jgi:uncharacterized protein YegP (UPF0339 family)